MDLFKARKASKGDLVTMMFMQYQPEEGYTTSNYAQKQTVGNMTGGDCFTAGIGGYQTNAYPTMGVSTGGFSFRKRNERVDWKKIACADVDHISRDLDFNTLQENIMNITFCNIDYELDVGSVEPHFVKLFKLAQLTVEYLLYSQDYLSGMITAVEERLRKTLEEHEETKKLLEKQKCELDEVRRESHKRKKMLIAQQQIMNAGINSYHKCTFCTKAFVNDTFLQSHLHRRHLELVSQYKLITASSSQSAQQQMLQQQPQQQLQQQQPLAQSQGQLSEEQQLVLQKELDEIRERLRLTESQLIDERNNRNSITAKEKESAAKREDQIQQEIEELKQHQMETQKEEMEKMRDMFMKELKEMNEKYIAATSALEVAQRKGRSNLGAMEDEVQEEQKQLRRQREEVAQLKELMQAQMSEVQASMAAKFEKQESRWKEKMEGVKHSYDKDIKWLKGTFEKNLEVNSESRGHSDMVEQFDQKDEEVNVVKQLSREQSRRFDEQEKHLRKMRQKSAAPVKVVTSPSVAAEDVVRPVSPIRERVLSPQHQSEIEDDDESDEDEDEESTEFGDSTLATTGMFNETGTLSLGTGTLKGMSVRLLERLKKNPDLLMVMKDELVGVLDDNLERRGISQSSTGISNAVLETKLHVLKNERQQLAKKFSNFYDIRQQYIKQIDELAREQLQKKKKEAMAMAEAEAAVAHQARPRRGPPPRPTSPAPAPSPARPRSAGRAGPSGWRGSPTRGGSPTRTESPVRGRSAMRGESPQSGSPQRGSPQRRSPRRSAPRPAPRALSPQGKLTNTLSSNATTTESQSTWGTSTAEWESDVNSDDDQTPHDELDGHRMLTPKKTSFAVNIPPHEVAEDSDWDDGSELEEITSHQKTPRSVNNTPPPKGPNVAKLTERIASQLGERGKKPVGGVETVRVVESKPLKKRDDSWDDDDDDAFSISSLEGSLTGSAPPSRNTSFNRKATTPSDGSTGTSLWGSSKDLHKPRPSPRKWVNTASTANRGAAVGSTDKTGVVSVSDFDDESDLSADDL